MSRQPVVIPGVVVLVLAGYVGYHGVHRRYQQEMTQLQAQLHDRQEVQDMRTQLAGALGTLERKRQRLAPMPSVDWLVQEIDTIAAATGLRLTRIVPQRPESVDDFTRIAVSLEFSASYHELGTFVSSLESGPHLIHVDSLAIGRAASEEEGTSAMTLLVSAWYVPPLPTARP